TILCTRPRHNPTMDKTPSTSRGRRNVVSKGQTSGNRRIGGQATTDPRPSRFTSIWTSRNTTNNRINRTILLVAPHEDGHPYVCQRMCGVSMNEDQYATREGAITTTIPEAR